MRMISRHKALAMAVAIGMLLVALVTTVAIAQTPPAPPGAQSDGQDIKYGQVFLDKLATILNIDRPTLDSAIKDAGKQTADEAVNNGDITQEQADRLKKRIDEGPNGCFAMQGWGGMMHRQFSGRFAGQAMIGGDSVIEAITSKLGITVDDLKAQLREGKSLTDLLTEKGISDEDLRAAVVEAIRPRLEQAVADGRLTQEQADSIVAKIQDGAFPMMLERGRGHTRDWGPKFRDTAPRPERSS